MDRRTYLQTWSTLHGGAVATGLVRGWLVGVHTLARPLVAVRTPPALVTLTGTVLAVFAVVLVAVGGAGGGAAVLAGGLLAVGGILDNLDGAVAVMRSRVSVRGAFLDACCDRVGDACCALLLWAAGAPVWLAVAAGGLAQLQEYVRARAQGLGVSDVGVVSVAERPVRLAIAAACTAATAVAPDVPWASVGCAVWVGLGLVGLGQVSVTLWRRL